MKKSNYSEFRSTFPTLASDFVRDDSCYQELRRVMAHYKRMLEVTFKGAGA